MILIDNKTKIIPMLAERLFNKCLLPLKKINIANKIVRTIAVLLKDRNKKVTDIPKGIYSNLFVFIFFKYFKDRNNIIVNEKNSPICSALGK
jgi:hypothetical protein